jgi:hypothetical protein
MLDLCTSLICKDLQCKNHANATQPKWLEISFKSCSAHSGDVTLFDRKVESPSSFHFFVGPGIVEMMPRNVEDSKLVSALLGERTVDGSQSGGTRPWPHGLLQPVR